MAQFYLHIFAPPPDIRARLQAAYPENFYEVTNCSWLVSAPLQTSRDVTERLGGSTVLGRYIALAITGYWGNHNPDMWEWMQLRAGS